jgi:hypothetical protein
MSNAGIWWARGQNEHVARYVVVDWSVGVAD